jgi:hypothetical protein
VSILTFIVASAFLLVIVIASVVPWVGHAVVKILTFGRIDLGWHPSDSESEVSTRIGFFVLLIIAGLVHN